MTYLATGLQDHRADFSMRLASARPPQLPHWLLLLCRHTLTLLAKQNCALFCAACLNAWLLIKPTQKSVIFWLLFFMLHYGFHKQLTVGRDAWNYGRWSLPAIV